MKRRNFIKKSIITGSVASMIPLVNQAQVNKEVAQNSNAEFYELRIYTLKNRRQQKMVEEYFQNAATPALNRSGSKNIGVFTEYLPQGNTKLFVLIPFSSLDDFLKMPDKMAA